MAATTQSAAKAYGLRQNPRNSSGVTKLAVVGVAFVVIGALAWFAQLGFGLIETSGMSNVYVWGLMIAVFAFLVGFGAGSQLVCTAIYLFGGDELKPYALIGAVAGLSCVAAAGVAILIDLGAIRNVLAMVLSPNPRSPLTWDMLALTLYLVLGVVQLVMIALEKPAAKLFAILAGAAAVLLQVVEGLLFSLQGAHAWWATPIMPVDFLAVAFVSGAALILFVAVARRAPESAVRWLAKFLAIAIVVHLVLALADLGMVVAEGTPQSAAVLAALGTYWWLYALELLLPAAAAVLLLVPGLFSRGVAGLAAALTAIGIFAHRLMLLYPSYGAPSLFLKLSGTDVVTGAYPISTGRYLDSGQAFSTASSYLPNGMEWVAAFLPLGVAMLAAAVIIFAMHALNKRVEH